MGSHLETSVRYSKSARMPVEHNFQAGRQQTLVRPQAETVFNHDPSFPQHTTRVAIINAMFNEAQWRLNCAKYQAEIISNYDPSFPQHRTQFMFFEAQKQLNHAYMMASVAGKDFNQQIQNFVKIAGTYAPTYSLRT